MNKRLQSMHLEDSGLKRQGVEHGFTLLEVMVAMAIFGVAVITLLGVFSNGLNLTRLTNKHTQAMILAQSKLAEFNTGLEQDVIGKQGCFDWEIDTSIIDHGLEKIVLTVSQDGNQKMHIVTLR
ncbi:MAG: prepilin-type N-terminal cleavage/methylation domain-containing protein [bacterium]|nr:prepilin-type N-terminal cleavage/methylation domain-containing protein [bacterium]